MHEELRLISIGFPLSEAVGICNAYRKEGTLEAFLQQTEEEYTAQIRTPDKEALS